MKRSKREEARKAGLRGIRKVTNALDPLQRKWEEVEASITQNLFTTFVSQKLGELRYRRRQQEKIHSDLKDLQTHTEKVLPDLLLQAYDVGRRVSATALDEQIVALTSTDRGALLILERNVSTRLSQSVDRVGRHVDDIFRRLGLQYSRDLVAGGSRNAPSKFAQELAKQGITVFEDTLGRKWDLARYADVATKTTATEAIALATQNYMRMRDLDIVEINRSANPCARCLPFNGKTFSLSGTSAKYPGLTIKFPIHPLCEHFMFPKFMDAEEQVGEGLELRVIGGIPNS